MILTSEARSIGAQGATQWTCSVLKVRKVLGAECWPVRSGLILVFAVLQDIMLHVEYPTKVFDSNAQLNVVCLK